MSDIYESAKKRMETVTLYLMLKHSKGVVDLVLDKMAAEDPFFFRTVQAQEKLEQLLEEMNAEHKIEEDLKH